MKRLTALFLACLLCLGLCACGEEKPVEPDKLKPVPASDADERAAQGLGHYVDLVNKHGKVVHRQYQTSKKEVDMRAGYREEAMKVTIVLGYPKVPPFAEIKAISLGQYEILDANDQPVAQGKSTQAFPVVDGGAVISFSLPEDMELGTGIYHIIIHHLIGEKKEDQVLDLAGTWDFTFAID